MVEICINIEHHYFREPLEVWIRWELPFLPRIGESVSPWFWIEQDPFTIEQIKAQLSNEGRKSWDDWDGELNDWLYEMGISADVIYNLSYYRKRDDKTPYVRLYMQEEKQ